MPETAGWLTWTVVASTSTATVVEYPTTYVLYLSNWGVLEPVGTLSQPPRLVEDSYAAQSVAQTRRFEAACARARETLLSLLTPTERERYQSSGEIHVTGSEGGRYRIRHGTTGNVVDDRGIRYCAHPPLHSREGDRLPDADVHIAQILALATDESGFLQIANRS